MELRPELCEPEVPAERLAALRAALERIEEQYWSGAATDEAIAALNADTGSNLELYDILSYHSSISVEDFARSLAWPAWPKVPDVTRAELIEIVRRALAAGDDNGYYHFLLDVNVAHPAPAVVVYRDGASPAEIVDEILSYRPIAL